jgi:hypothetical protein
VENGGGKGCGGVFGVYENVINTCGVPVSNVH